MVRMLKKAMKPRYWSNSTMSLLYKQIYNKKYWKISIWKKKWINYL